MATKPASSFTPGPWEMGQTQNYETALVAPGSGIAVAYAAWDGGSGCHLEIENDADARLIAAAPELYAALVWAEATIAPFSREPAEKSGINMVRAALAKARGQ